MGDLSPADRLFVSDLDGTLLLPDKTLGPRTRLAIERLARAGGWFTVATGRGAGATAAALGGLRLPLDGILHNGALAADLSTGAISWTAALEGPVAGELFRRACAHQMTPVAYALPAGATRAGQTVLFHGPGPINRPTRRYLESVRAHHRFQVDDGSRLGGGSMLSMILLDDPDRVGSFITTECAPLTDVRAYPSVSAYTPGLAVGEVTAAAASKASAAAQIAQSLGLGLESVVAFGDNLNDLPLLEAAGWAFCPPDAPVAVLQRVAGRIGSTAEEGVAAYLEQWLEDR